MNHLFQVVGGLLVAQLEGQRIVLDTGSPMSFSRAGVIRFGETDHAVERSSWAGDADSLSGWAGSPLDGLVGCDILGSCRFTIDRDAGVVVVEGDDRADASVDSFPFEQVMGVPIVATRINGASLRTAADTGAVHCFACAEHLAGTPQDGAVEDFYPGFGRFRASTHRAPVELESATAGPARELSVAAIPEGLGSLLAMFSIDAILGLDFLLKRRLTFDFTRRTISIGG
jgi:hypothetical protein